LIQTINVNLDDIKKQAKVTEFLEENIQKLIYEYGFDINDKEYLKIMYFIYRDFVGLDEIEPLLADPFIEDIGCDGIGLPIYVVHQKFGSIKSNIVFKDEKTLREFVTKLAERCDRYISYAEPLLDGSLPDGTRVQASLAKDVTTRGPTFSLRKFREVPFTPVDIMRLKTASAEMLAYLWFVVENGANILIAGGVSTGKTSLLNCISLFIPTEAKIVSIEDTRELNLPHENWIPGVARVGFSGTGVGEVSMFELLKESFRQNPDYLIVGEIRGKEAYVMFQGMASGHPSLSTVHAGSVDDLMKRLQTHPINLSPGLMESLNIVIVMAHAREKGKSARRIKEIDEIESIDADTGVPRIVKSFVWTPSDDVYEYRGSSWILSKISREKGMGFNNILKDISRRKKLIDWLFENNVTDLSTVTNYIRLYRINPEKIEDIIAGKDQFRDKYLETASENKIKGLK
jgi:flagellar protein FlaI